MRLISGNCYDDGQRSETFAQILQTPQKVGPRLTLARRIRAEELLKTLKNHSR